MASRIASFVGTVQLRLKIEQGTSTEDEPTPIYLLDEIVKEIGSTSKNVADAVEVIQQRLQHRSPTVKQKALRLVKHAAQRGSPELRRSLARQSHLVRDLTHFKCAPDPFKGDIPWKRVQEYAKEALDALHAAPDAQQASPGPQLGRRIQGFGSEGGGAATSSGMMGFGSESAGYNNYSSGAGILSGGAGGGSFSNRTPLGGGGAGGGSGPGAVLESLSYGVKDLTDRAVGALTRPNHHRLGSIDSEDGVFGPGYGSSKPLMTSGGGGQGFPGQISRAPDANGGLSSSPTAAQLSRETRLVERLCTPSGMRAAPSAEDLKGFVAAVGEMDGGAIAAALHQKLETGSWQETLRALCAIEAILEHNSSPSSGEVGVHFQANVSIIRRAQQSAQATVRQRAERVLRLLGGDTLPAEGAAVRPSQDLLGDDLVVSTESALSTQSTQSTMDLLAGLDVAPTPASASASAVPSQGSQAFDILGDLMGPSPPSSAVLHPPVAAPAAAPAAAQPVDDLFGDWSAPPVDSQPSVISRAAPQPPVFAAQVQPQAQQPGSINILDALSDLSINSSPSAPTTHSQPSQSNFMMGFDSLNLSQAPLGMATAAPAMAPLQVGGAPSAPAPAALSPQLGAPLDDFFSMPATTIPASTLPTTLPYISATAGSSAFGPPAGSFEQPVSLGGGIGSGQQQGRMGTLPSMGYNVSSNTSDDILGAINAATSGISSAKREDVAFDFVQGAMAQLKTKK